MYFVRVMGKANLQDSRGHCVEVSRSGLELGEVSRKWMWMGSSL